MQDCTSMLLADVEYVSFYLRAAHKFMVGESVSQIYGFTLIIPCIVTQRQSHSHLVQSSPASRTKHIDVDITSIKEQVKRVVSEYSPDPTRTVGSTKDTHQIEIASPLGLDDGVAASFQRSRIHKPHAHTQAFKVNPQVDQGSQIKMIHVKEMMQDNDLKNSKSKHKGSKTRSQSMNEQSRYKQDKTKTRQSINVKSHIFNIKGDNDKSKQTPTRMSSVVRRSLKKETSTLGEIVSLNYIKSNKNVIGLRKSN
ncbi:hypothetical protein Tco_0500698 [Tanacetum coccineum]